MMGQMISHIQWILRCVKYDWKNVGHRIKDNEMEIRSKLALLIALVLALGILSTARSETIIKLESETRFSHHTGDRYGYDPPPAWGGESANGGWRCIAGHHVQGYHSYGPYRTLPTASTVYAQWRIRAARLPTAGSRWLFGIEVYDSTARHSVWSQIVRSRDFQTGTYRLFNSDRFRPVHNHAYEFRLYYWPQADIFVDWVKVNN